MQRKHMQQEAMCTQYTNKYEVTMDLIKKAKKKFTSITFVRLFAMRYKRARQYRRRVVKIQSTLCEVACEQNSCGFKISVVSRIVNSCMREISNMQLLL